MKGNQLLLQETTPITCPECGEEFALDQGFKSKALKAVVEASQAAFTALRDAEREQVEARAQELVKEQARVTGREVTDLKALLQQQAETHARTLVEARALAEKNAAPKLMELQAELASRDATLQTLRNEQLELRRERQQLRDEKDALALEVQKQVDAQLLAREHLVRQQEREAATMARAELQKKLDDANADLSATKLRMEQGSQQLQGEVLELAVEEGLRRAFPLDVIEEVKKGARGGDIMQHVTTRTGQACGTVLWETKRAAVWSPQWVTKLKEDMRSVGAAIGVLVTMPGTTPREWPTGAHFALHEEVWVTQMSTAVSVAEALRCGLIDVHRTRAAAAGKGEKAEALYDYLTSPQFAHKLRAVFETFKRMKEELETEKNVTQQRWARREKALTAGTAELLGIGGEIQGLAQSELPALELQGEQG